MYFKAFARNLKESGIKERHILQRANNIEKFIDEYSDLL